MLGMGNVQIAKSKSKSKSKEGNGKEMGDKVVKGSFIGSLIRRRAAVAVEVQETQQNVK